MWQIRLSRRRLRRLAWAVLPLAVLAGLLLLGRSVTPRDETGEPLILSPSLKATLEYQAQARRWAERLSDLDGGLESLLTDRRDIYHQTEAVGELLDRSLRLAQDVEVRRAPAALAGLRSMLSWASLAYLEAVRAAADWVGAPTPEQEEGVYAHLEAARALLAQLQGSRWLQESAPASESADESQEVGGW